MEHPEHDDAPLADAARGGGAVPNDMPVDPEAEEAARRPQRTERQEPEPRPERDHPA